MSATVDTDIDLKAWRELYRSRGKAWLEPWSRRSVPATKDEEEEVSSQCVEVGSPLGSATTELSENDMVDEPEMDCEATEQTSSSDQTDVFVEGPLERSRDAVQAEDDQRRSSGETSMDLFRARPSLEPSMDVEQRPVEAAPAMDLSEVIEQSGLKRPMDIWTVSSPNDAEEKAREKRRPGRSRVRVTCVSRPGGAVVLPRWQNCSRPLPADAQLASPPKKRRPAAGLG